MTEIPVNTANPLLEPYRTGEYLISDAGPDNFRSAMALPDHPYRASGSHQLGIADWVRVFQQLPADILTLHLVDLRQESHGYLNGGPYSWYADNDWGNVGAGKTWIVSDEIGRLSGLEGKNTKIFTIEVDPTDDLKQERMLPTSFSQMRVSSVRTEAEVVEVLSDVFAPVAVEYHRIPVTDHCAPDDTALSEISNLGRRVGPNDWIHFHCHGGDGRTTTFLLLYDIISWKRETDSPAHDPLPSLEEFVARQLLLFDYDLTPSASSGWKEPLAQARWEALQDYLKFANSSSTYLGGSGRAR